MTSQQDYILFLHGLGMLVLHAACVLLARFGDRPHLPWKWLSRFAVLTGLGQWAAILALRPLSCPVASGVSVTLRAAGALALAMFAWEALEGSRRALRALAAMLAVAALGVGAAQWAGSGPAQAWAVTLAPASGVAAAIALWQAGKRRADRLTRLLIGSAVALAFHTAATVLTVAQSLTGLPALKDASPTRFLLASSAQALCALSAIAMATLIVICYRSSTSGVTFPKAPARSRSAESAAAIALVLVALGGWVLTETVGRRADSAQRKSLRHRAASAAAGIDPAFVTALTGLPGSEKRPEHIRILESLRSVRGANPECRFVYLVGRRGAKTVFLADAEPPSSADYSAPGDVYSDAPPQLLDAMRAHRPTVVGPFTDAWGTWVSAFVPARTPGAGNRAVMLGMDIDAHVWAREVAESRLAAIIVVLLITAVVMVLLVAVSVSQAATDCVIESERELQRRAEFLQVLLDAIPVPVFYKGRDGNYLGCNQACAEASGFSTDDMVGRSVSELAPPQEAPVLKAMDDELLRNGGRLTYESAVKYADGSTHDVILYKAVIPSSDGGISGLVGTALDVTEMRRGEERLRRLNECLLSLGADTRENIDRLTALCGELLGASCALYNRLRDGALKAEGRWNGPAHLLVDPKAKQSLCSDLLQRDQRDIVVVRSLRDSSYAAADPAIRDSGFSTYVGKVVRLGGEPVGVLCALFAEDKEPSEDDKRVVEIATSAIEIEESRRAAEDALRLERDKLETVTANIGAGIALISPDYHVLWANKVMEGVFGSVSGMKCHTAFHGNDHVCVGCGARQILETGCDMVTHERNGWRENGQEVWTQVVATPVRDEQGNVTAVLEIAMPITERKRMEEALRENEARYRTLFDNSAEGILVLTDVFLDCNEQACRLWGCAREQIIGRSPADFSPPLQPDGRRSYDAALDYIRAAMAGTPQLFRWKHMKADGTVIDTEVGLNAVTLDGQRVLQATVRDITERTAAEEAVRSQISAMNAASDQILIANPNGEVVFANSAFLEEMGCSESEVIGRQMRRWMGTDRRQELDFDEIWNTVVKQGTWHGEILRSLDDGSDRYEDTTLTAVRDSSGEIESVIAIKRNVTDKKVYEERLDHLAHHDPLTGLPNRLLFSDRLNHSLAQAKRHDTMAAVMFLDLDRFKLINDTMGHKAGDVLLWQVAGRLTKRLRGVDTIARMGGDEFTVVLTDIASAEDAAAVAGRVLSLFAEPFMLAGRELFVSTSVGISVYPNDGTDVETLVRNADAAMYRAKEQGKNSFCLYTESLNAAAMEQMTLLNNLRRALQNGEFSLHYQPRVGIESGGIVGIEALIRWHHPELGWIPPGQFIPLAEETGLIGLISEWVLKTACRQNKAWQEAGLPEMDVAVNISARELEDDAFVRLVRSTLDETGLHPGCLGLEVTEGTLMRNPELSAEILDNLKAMGVKISIDDFGTGHSSLSKLKRLPIHTVKIDQSFIKDIATNSDDAAIAEAVVAMAHSLKLNVLAEGVETLEQLELLRSLGCDEVQGYFISKPLPADELAEALSETQRRHGARKAA